MKKERIISKVQKIYMIIICVNIALLNIFIGSTHYDPRSMLETLIILEAVIYIVILKINKKNNILIKGKIDIFVFLMMIITAVPLFTKTYCSLSDTIDIFIEYVTVYSMYIMVRNVITTDKRKNILINVMLISSTVIVIFGIDRLNFEVFKKFYDWAKLPQVSDWRMTSTIGYCNAVFAYIVSLIILALGKFLENDKAKIAGIYAIYIQVGMYALYYTNSRAGMVILAIIFIAYLFKLQNINKIIKSVIIFGFPYLSVVVFDRIKNIYCSKVSIFFGFLITIIITYLVSVILVEVFNKKQLKTNKKIIIITILGLIAGVVIYIAIAKNYSTPLIMKDEYDTRSLYTLKENTTYNLKINYTYYGEGSLLLKAVQIDNKRVEKILFEKNLEQKGENLNVEFTITTTNIDYLMLDFYSPKGNKIILNKMYVNGKEEVVNYKFLPNDIMRMIQTFNMKNISIAERLSMYKSGMKLFKVHPIVGNGAKTYINLYTKVREYGYQTTEVHSYYLDILMDYGIIGISICLLILFFSIYNFIKRKDKKNILNNSIFFAWLLVTIHTAIDFDLAYMVTISNFYMLICFINEEDRNIKIKTKSIENIILAILSIALIFNITSIPGRILYNKKEYKKALKFIPYAKNNTYEYIDQEGTNTSMDIIERYLKNEKNSKQFDIIKILYDKSIKLIKGGNLEEGIEGLQKIVLMLKKDDILVKDDVVKKDNWNIFVNRMINDIEESNQVYLNDNLNNVQKDLKEALEK